MITQSKGYMTKSIRISDDNYKKLQRIGKGSYDEKFSVLLEKQQQQLIDQNNPIADESTEPANDLIVGLMLQWLIKCNDDNEDDLNDSMRQIIQNEIDKGRAAVERAVEHGKSVDKKRIQEALRVLEARLSETYDQTTRAFLISSVQRALFQNGWFEQYPLFYEGHEKRNSRFEKKVDNAIGLLVRNEIIERYEEGYRLLIDFTEYTKEKISALKHLPYYSTVPKIYYKESQRKELFKNGIGNTVPHIHLHE